MSTFTRAAAAALALASLAGRPALAEPPAAGGDPSASRLVHTLVGQAEGQV